MITLPTFSACIHLDHSFDLVFLSFTMSTHFFGLLECVCVFFFSRCVSGLFFVHENKDYGIVENGKAAEKRSPNSLNASIGCVLIIPKHNTYMS